jgi:pectate lyase
MKNSLKLTQIVASLLAVATASWGCSDDSPTTSASPLGGGGAAPSGGGGTTAGTAGASEPTSPAGGGAGGNSEVLPDLPLANQDLPVGWASVWPGDDDGITNGGGNADAGHIFTVTNRTELVRALYPDAVIADDGTFTSEDGADPTPKIIYVRGTISLSTNAAGDELTLEDYACDGYDFEAYKAAYDPKEWNKQPLVAGDPPAIQPCPGSQEELRQCSSNRQALVVQLRVGSNTTLLGVGADAKIVHGMVLIGAGSFPPGRRLPPAPPSGAPEPIDPELAAACGIELPPAPEPEPEPDPVTEPAPTPAPAPAPAPSPPFVENVIVRNITFEDAYDLFPSWDPADSYATGPEVADPEDVLYPQCQATYDAATDNGPHQCRGGRWNSRYDNVQVQNASHVWIDHSTFNDGDRETQSIPSVWAFPYDDHVNAVQPHDGLLDIVNASDFVTVSYSSFQNHDKTTLIGGSDTVTERNGWGALSVTVHHNQYINVGQRTPRVRFGKAHVYSNFVQGSLNPAITVPADRAKPSPAYPMDSAMAAGHLAKLYSENNAFEITGYPGDPPPTALDIISTAHRATPTEGDGLDVNQSTYFFDSGSTLNGAPTDLNAAAQESAASGDRPALLSTETIWTPSASYEYQVTPAEDVKQHLEANAGVGVIQVSGP